MWEKSHKSKRPGEGTGKLILNQRFHRPDTVILKPLPSMHTFPQIPNAYFKLQSRWQNPMWLEQSLGVAYNGIWPVITSRAVLYEPHGQELLLYGLLRMDYKTTKPDSANIILYRVLCLRATAKVWCWGSAHAQRNLSWVWSAMSDTL